MRWLICLIIVLIPLSASAQYAEWDPNPESDLLGYRVFIGPSPYMSVDFEDPDGLGEITTTGTTFNLSEYTGYMYIWLTAVDTSLNESEESDYIAFDPRPHIPTGMSLFTLYLREGDLWNEA